MQPEIYVGSLNDLGRLEDGAHVVVGDGADYGYVSDTRIKQTVPSGSYRRSYPAWVNNDSIFVATCRPREIVVTYWSWRMSPKPEPEYISLVLGLGKKEIDGILNNVRRRKPVVVAHDSSASGYIRDVIRGFLGSYNELADRLVVQEYDTKQFPIRHCKTRRPDQHCPVCAKETEPLT